VPRPITLPVPGLDALRSAARSEGFHFIDTLIDQWASGDNRFDRPGEILLGCFEDNLLAAVGGLNIDPFLNNPQTGRIRRVYVRPASRGRGLGRSLVIALLEHARSQFRSVRLRAVNPAAARLYERLEFHPVEDPNATHILTLEP